MKKTVILISLSIILSVGVAVLSVFTSVSICTVTDKRYYMIAVFAVIGLIGGYLLHNALHEGGHALFAKLCGAKVFEVAFCGFVFTKNKGVKLNFKSGVAGWTDFVPLKPENSEEVLNKSLLGGLIGSFVSLFVAMILYVSGILVRSYPLVSAFGFYGAVNVYMITVNFFSSAPKTDGKLMFSSDDEYKDAVSLLEYQSYLLNGVSAKNIPQFDSSNLNKRKTTTLYDVQKALQKGKINEASDLSDWLLSRYKKADNGLIAVYLEKLFVSVLSDDKENVEKYYPLCRNEIEYPSSSSSLRVACYYRKYNGENDWANSLRKTFYHSLDDCPLNGLAETEKEIFENYIYYLEK